MLILLLPALPPPPTSVGADVNLIVDTLAPGAVVDVEFILGETTQPKVSERETNG